MDYNGDGSISLQELSTEMEKHRISFTKGASLNEQILNQLAGKIGVKKSESL